MHARVEQVALVIAGAAVMAYSVFAAARCGGLARRAGAGRAWWTQLGLMACFLLGYGAAIALLLSDHVAILLTLTSGVFLGGSVFVAVTVHLTRRITTAVVQKQEALARANVELEHRVLERTRELSAANEELRHANGALAREMKERLQIEVELRQAQKLEAVGRLAAGVAHELNTPLQFVSDSIAFVRDASDELFPLIRTLQATNRSVLAGAPSAPSAEAAAEAEERADLPYLIANVPPALEQAADGVKRVAAIVRSMKEFAQPDTTEMSEVDLNGAIESTLTVAHAEYEPVAELETSFGEIPRIVCHAGQINQAVLNIVVNAAHAVGDVVKGSGRKGRISVSTELRGAHVVVAISDTGTGIPAEIRDRIFDPFFTTKDYGRGTGQGLSIARAIVVGRHGGELTVTSELGRGTTFFIRLPAAGTRRLDAAPALDLAG